MLTYGNAEIFGEEMVLFKPYHYNPSIHRKFTIFNWNSEDCIIKFSIETAGYKP